MKRTQQSTRCVILLHEIYGVNAHIKHYADLFYKQNYDVHIPNLLNKDLPFSYEEEERAYRHFTENIGFEKAQKQVLALIDELSSTYNEIHIVGFSIGATIAWLCSEDERVHTVIGFYGSRIRQYTNIMPKAKVILLFGEHEKSFNPYDVKARLTLVTNVEVKIYPSAHGFADPFSAAYDEPVTKVVIEDYIYN